jgi:hypothetical protein
MYSVFKTVQKKGHIGLKTFPNPYTLGKLDHICFHTKKLFS